MSAHTRYIRQTLAVTLTLTGLLAMFTAAIDPFGIFRGYGLPTAPGYQVVWSRVSAAERLLDDCEVLLLGSSRVMYGFGPEMPSWAGQKTCNGSVGGTSMVELASVFDLAITQPKVNFAIVFIDFHMFNDTRGYNADWPQSRFNAERTSLTFHAWATTSLDASKYAVRSLIGSTIPVVDTRRAVASPLKANRVELYRFLRSGQVFKDYESFDHSMALLARLLDQAREHEIQVMLVIPPVHATVLEAMHRTDVWRLNNQWKRELVELTSNRGDQKVPLWDFATFHAPAMAEVPIKPRDRPHPYWVDVSHQSKELGRLTMMRIRDAYTGTPNDIDPAFGALLTPENIDAHIATMKPGRERWRREHPEQADFFDRFADNAEGVETDQVVPEAGVHGPLGTDVDLPAMGD